MKNRKDDQCVEYLRGHPCDYEAWGYGFMQVINPTVESGVVSKRVARR